MNWLAHVFLSDPDAECRLGNLLADVVKGKARVQLPPKVQRGIRCHQAIDAFTDYHPIVSQSKARVAPALRRYAGIVIDVFYDHFLARNWKRYCDVSLSEFTDTIYETFTACADELPADVQTAVRRLRDQDLLGSYRHIEGIEKALAGLSRRLSQRLGRPIALQPAVVDLRANFQVLQGDFLEFFPQLCDHVENWRQGDRL